MTYCAPVDAFTTDWPALGLDYGTGRNAFDAVPPKSTAGECTVPKRRGRPSKVQQSVAALMSDAERKLLREARITAFKPGATSNFVMPSGRVEAL